ncbi:MAG: zinc ribbon domain-containing protein [Eubacteriales bacterium]
MNNFCGECGNKLADNVSFCGECGAKIQKEQPVNQTASEIVKEKQPVQRTASEIVKEKQPVQRTTSKNVTTNQQNPQLKKIEIQLSQNTSNLLQKCELTQEINASYYIDYDSKYPNGGKITFYEDGFCYQTSGKLNFETGSIHYYYSDIEKLEDGYMPSSIEIILKDETKHMFGIVKKEKKKVMEFLSYMMKHSKTMPFSSSKFIYDTPKLGEKPSDLWVWGCCGVQVLSIIISIQMGNDPSKSPIELAANMKNLLAVIYSANCGLLYIDGVQLRKRGLTPVESKWTWLVPVYLFKRAKGLGHDNKYAIAWCVAFVISLLFS